MSTPDLPALIDLCKRHGLRRLKIADVEIEFAGSGDVTPAMVKSFQDVLAKGLANEPDPLFWSAPGMEAPKEEEPEAPKARGRRS